MSTANLTRAETAARSAAVTVLSYRVELDISGAPDNSEPGFATSTTVEFDSGTSETWIDFLGPEVRSVTVNGEAVDIEFDGARIALRGLRASNTVVIAAVGAYSRSGEGLHRFHDPVDGRTYLYTQYEPSDARRVFACFEQPDMKAPFTFVVTAPAGWEVVSNRPAALHHVDDTRQVVEFSPHCPSPRTSPRSSRVRIIVSNPSGAETISPSRSGCCAGRRWRSTSTPTRSSR